MSRGRTATALVLLVLTATACEQQEAADRSPEEARPIIQVSESSPAPDFDFFVLSLSWSPTFCELGRQRSNPSQCGRGKNFGFIVHGLWPQYEQGYPQFCDDNPDRIDRNIVDGLMDIVPSRSLIAHQWKKHGSCADSDPRTYFQTMRKAFETVDIPPMFATPSKRQTVSTKEVEDAFLAANAGMKANGIAVTCEDGRLDEARICMTTDLKFRSCPSVNRSECRQKKIAVPAP